MDDSFCKTLQTFMRVTTLALVKPFETINERFNVDGDEKTIFVNKGSTPV